MKHGSWHGRLCHSRHGLGVWTSLLGQWGKNEPTNLYILFWIYKGYFGILQPNEHYVLNGFIYFSIYCFKGRMISWPCLKGDLLGGKPLVPGETCLSSHAWHDIVQVVLSPTHGLASFHQHKPTILCRLSTTWLISSQTRLWATQPVETPTQNS